MTSKNGWMNDWELAQDTKNDTSYSFKRTEPSVQVSPLSKYSLVELTTEVLRRLSEIEGVKTS